MLRLWWGIYCKKSTLIKRLLLCIFLFEVQCSWRTLVRPYGEVRLENGGGGGGGGGLKQAAMLVTCPSDQTKSCPLLKIATQIKPECAAHAHCLMG